MPTTEELEQRIGKLERQGALKFFVQYLLSPILILSIGTIINWQIEKGKAESNRLDIAQKMITPLFAGNPDQAFATERLLARIVDDETARELHEIIAKYYQSKIDSNLREGNIEGAEKIVSAAKTIGGDAADQVVKSVEKDRTQADSIQTFKNKNQIAAQKEREGFESLIAGDYDKSIKAFQEAETAYPSYHQVYELARLIKQKKSELTDPEKRKETFHSIATRYSYGAPADLIEKIREMSN